MAAPVAGPAMPASTATTFEDVVSNLINARAIAAFLPPFELAAKLMSLSHGCATAAIALLRDVVAVELPDLEDPSGELLRALLAAHLDRAAVARLLVPQMEAPRAWVPRALSLGFMALRELEVYVTDAALAAVLPAFVTSCEATLTYIKLWTYGGCPASTSVRVLTSRAIGRCRRLREAALCTTLLESTTSASICSGAPLRRLCICARDDDANRAAAVAAALLEDAASAGVLHRLALTDFAAPAAADVAAVMQDALGAALPHVAELYLRDFYGAWAIPPLPRLRALEWRHGGDVATFARLLHHSPALERVEAPCLPAGAAGVAEALVEQHTCRHCVAGAGAALTAATIDSVGALRLLTASLSSCGGGARLASVTLKHGSADLLSGSDEAVGALAALPPSVRRLTVFVAGAPAQLFPVLASLAAVPSFVSLLVRGADDSEQQITILRAAVAARRGGPPVRVTFRGGNGPAVCAQLALPAPRREAWMAALDDHGAEAL